MQCYQPLASLLSHAGCNFVWCVSCLSDILQRRSNAPLLFCPQGVTVGLALMTHVILALRAKVRALWVEHWSVALPAYSVPPREMCV
jgi:hypothetical protein